jgi:hypothetical protein
MTALLRALEEYHASATAFHHRLTNPLPAHQWLRLGFAVLTVEGELSRLGFGPVPPPSTSCPADLDVPGFAELMRQLRGGADGWGHKVGGYWVECCRVATVTGPEPLTPEAREEAFAAALQEAFAHPDLKDVSSILAPLHLYVSGWRTALRQAGAADELEGGDSLPSLSQQEAAVLKALLQSHPVRLTVEGVERKVRFTDRTIRRALQSLSDRAAPLVEEPEPKKGHGLTPAGYALARGLPPDAGAELLNPASPGR